MVVVTALQRKMGNDGTGSEIEEWMIRKRGGKSVKFGDGGVVGGGDGATTEDAE